MSWLDIFRKKKEQEKEKLSFSEIKGRLEQKQKEIEEAKIQAKKEIQKQVNNFNLEIKEIIQKLKLINLNSRKEEERIKLIVMENLKLYIEYLERLVQSLKDSDNFEASQYIKNISQIFDNFNKNSKMAFEKATILIGKELGEVKDKIKELSANFNNILKEKADILSKSDAINELKIVLGRLDEDNENKSEIEASIINLESNYKALSEDKIKLEKQIKELKNSSDFARLSEEKEIKLKKKQNINNEILKIKEKIDLRFLAKFFHNDKKKSDIIKRYSENFSRVLEEDNNLEIISLVKEAKNIDISELEKIKKDMLEISKQVISEIENKLNNLENKEKKLSFELSGIQEEMRLEKEKITRFNNKALQEKQDIIEKAKSLFNSEII